MKKIAAVVLGVLLLNIPQSSWACSLAFWNNNKVAKVVARSMDLYVSDEPLLVVSPRGTERKGGEEEKSVKWKSKYGSVVLTAFRSDVVDEGINEMSLSGHLLYLDGTEYEKPNAKASLSNFLWLQYALDHFKTVNEAIEGMKDLRIVSSKVAGREWPVHLALEDLSGDSAIFEIIKGKMVIHHGPQYTVMTNEPAFDIQLANLKKYKLFGGKLAMPGDIDPLSRFVRAASYLKTLPEPQNYVEAVAGVLSVMRTAMVPFGAEDTSHGISADTWPTRWVSMQDLTNKIFYFSSTQAPNVIWLDFKNLNFSEKARVLQLDPTQASLSGEVSRFLKTVSPAR